MKLKQSLSAVLALLFVFLPALACKFQRNSYGPRDRSDTNRDRGPTGRRENPNETTGLGNGNYVGDLNGSRAVANVSFEPLREYTIMAGEIRSNEAYYTFTADIVGTSGYGDILDHADGSRFRIKIDLMADGFILTSNPLGPGTPTSYRFVKQ